MAGCNWDQLLPFQVQVWLEKPVPVVALPPNSRSWLVAGSKTFSLTFKTGGSTQTVAATDITDGSKTASTSPAISPASPAVRSRAAMPNIASIADPRSSTARQAASLGAGAGK